MDLEIEEEAEGDGVEDVVEEDTEVAEELTEAERIGTNSQETLEL